MKKNLLIALFGTALVVLSACTEETPETITKTDLARIEEAMPTVYKGLHIELESYVVEDTLTVKAALTNESEQAIPLSYVPNQFITVTLATEEKVIQAVTLPYDQKSISGKEQVVFDASYVLPSVDQDYTVSAHLHVKAKKDFRYTEKELSAVEVVRKEREKELVFLPKKKVTYVYETKRNEQIALQEETFVQFQNDFVQSVDSERGTKIYYVDQKGLYIAYRTDEVIRENLIGEVSYMKQLVLGFPLKNGTNWEVDGVNYSITALDQTLKTPIGTFHDVVEVTSDFGTGMQYAYQKDIGLLEVRVKNGDQWETTTRLVQKK